MGVTVSCDEDAREVGEDAAASLLSIGPFLRSVLNFYGVGSALMRTLDLYFIQRWTFAFSDVCLTQRSSCES